MRRGARALQTPEVPPGSVWVSYFACIFSPCQMSRFCDIFDRTMMMMAAMAAMMSGFCSGAGPRASMGSAGALVRTVTWFVLMMSAAPVAAVCPHCGGWCEGCAGDDTCPHFAGVRSNLAAIQKSSITSVPSLAQKLPVELLNVFTRNVVEAIVGCACSPGQADGIDFSTDPYKASSAVVRAAFYGHCTYDDAALELTSRLDKATDSVEVTKIVGALDLLKSKEGVTRAAAHTGQGVYTFIWAKIGEHLQRLKDGTIRLAAGAATVAKMGGDLVAKIRHPDSYHDFVYRTQLWTQVVVACGLIGPLAAMAFITKVVFDTVNRLKKTWQVAYCAMLVYWKAIENDATRALSLGNVFKGGAVDLYLQEAEQQAAVIFRPRGGTPLDDDDIDDESGREANRKVGDFDVEGQTESALE